MACLSLRNCKMQYIYLYLFSRVDLGPNIFDRGPEVMYFGFTTNGLVMLGYTGLRVMWANAYNMMAKIIHLKSVSRMSCISRPLLFCFFEKRNLVLLDFLK